MSFSESKRCKIVLNQDWKHDYMHHRCSTKAEGYFKLLLALFDHKLLSLLFYEPIFTIWSKNMFLLHVIRVLRFAFKEAKLKFGIFFRVNKKKWFLQLLLKWNCRICFTYKLICSVIWIKVTWRASKMVWFFQHFSSWLPLDALVWMWEKSVCFLLSFFSTICTYADMTHNKTTERSL